MIEMKLRDGTIFDPADATWTLTVPGREGTIYGWSDVVLIGMLEPSYDVVHGVFGPAKMPIRGVRFTDLSDLAVEVPLPLSVAREMGELLSTSKIEVVKSLPASILFGHRPG